MNLTDIYRRLTRKPNLFEMTQEELRMAHLEKLSAETALDYAKSVVQYNEERIARLNKRIAEYR